MLLQLHIQNYAIVEEVTIPFTQGFTVITGETGAGKSVIMGALALILGERADSAILPGGEKKCVVEGLFSWKGNSGVGAFLEKQDLDVTEEVSIRREIAANGKSRAFVNDTPVHLEQLRLLAALLVDLHQQFDSLSVMESDFQRSVVDALAGHGGLVEEYSQQYREWTSTVQELQSLIRQQAQFQKESDYHTFLMKELQDASIQEGELESLEIQLNTLHHSEEMKTALDAAYQVLEEGDMPLLQELKRIAQTLDRFSPLQPLFGDLSHRLRSSHLELQDIADEIQTLNSKIQMDPQTLETINERLHLGYKLLKKHGLKTSAELRALQRDLEKKIFDARQLEDQIAHIQKMAGTLQERCELKAAQISQQRKRQFPVLEKQVNALLKQVGMPNARISVQGLATELGPFGIDRIEFLFDANKSGKLERLSKVASGGELSRLMLCIKSLVAKLMDLPTMIFDEIDTGISGEAARQVGGILQALAGQRQVIVITHQPQVAGRADTHFLVYKATGDQGFKTQMKKLAQEERVQHLAEMLAGAKPSAAALANARELMLASAD